MPRKYKYTDDMIRDAVQNSTSMVDAVRLLGASRTSMSLNTHLKKRAISIGCDLSHFFIPSTRGQESKAKLLPDSIFVLNRRNGLREKSSILRRGLLSLGMQEVCSICKLETTWNDKSIKLEIDHINKNPTDNRLENLRFLCPNCHSQV